MVTLSLCPCSEVPFPVESPDDETDWLADSPSDVHSDADANRRALTQANVCSY